MTAVRGFFSQSYSEARERFRRTAASAFKGETYRNANARGPNGEDLTTDVVRLGPDRAETVFFASSGTHGVEGYCGSGCQIGWIATALYRELPAGAALVFVHANNPYGFAHDRRVTEDNVDLNRNFRDHAKPPAHNADYAEVHPYLIPADWDGLDRERADRAIMRYIEERSERAFQAAVTTGQWEYPDGLFFGGRRAGWSNETWRTIVRKHAAGARRIVHFDFHTGLGAYGDCEVIWGPTRFERADLERARAWFGNVTCPSDGDSLSAPVQGVIPNAISEEVPGVEVTALALEYGTLPTMEVLNSLRADHWLYTHGDPKTPLGQLIKRQIRAAFYGETGDWKEKVFGRSVELFRQAVAGLKRP